MTQFFTFSVKGLGSLDTSRELTYTVALPDSAPWHEVLEHFAAFLESHTYVGVKDRLEEAGVV